MSSRTHFFIAFPIITFILLPQALSLVCPRGTYRHNRASVCIPCRPGTFQSLENAERCEPCAAGRYLRFFGSQREEACRPCSPNTFSSPGASSCTPCPTGTSSHSGSAECISCPKGTFIQPFGPGGKPYCEECHGYGDEENLLECKSCPPGSSAPPGATSIAQCTTCPAGTYSNGINTCDQCPSSTFSSAGSSECQVCPDGSVSEKDTGSTKCIPCKPGQYGRSERIFYGSLARCFDCPENTTSYSRGATICRRLNGPCPTDYLQTSAGDCVQCNVDQRYDVSQERCINCPLGEGSVGGLPLRCAPCPQVHRAGITESRCWVHGMVPYDADGSCPPGSKVSGLGKGRECLSCYPGEFSPVKNSPKCFPCPYGTISGRASAKCEWCPKGTVPDDDHVKCVVPQTNCPLGTHLVFGEHSSTCELDVCTLRNSSTSRPPICDNCYLGALHNRTLCPACPGNLVRGQTSETGTRYACLCRGPLSQNVGIVDGVCSRCPPGSYGKSPNPYDDDQDNICVKCPAGSYRVVSNYRKLLQNFCPRCTIPEPCQKCPTGFVTRQAGATKCEKCPDGTFTYGMGGKQCLKFGAESAPVPFNDALDLSVKVQHGN